MLFSPATAPVELTQYSITDEIRHVRAIDTYSAVPAPPISEITCGRACYHTRRPLATRFVPAEEIGRFFVEVLSPMFYGSGKTYEDAFDDFCERVHYEIQQLRSLRPFEMSDLQKRTIDILATAINLERYERGKGVELREIGEVRYGDRQLPTKIRWMHGLTEAISLEMMPDNYASFKPGQWLEAIVERNPITGRIMNCSYVAPISTRHLPSKGEVEEFWSSLSLPDEVQE